MHARELVELAAIVSAHGPVLVRGGGRVSPAAIQQYWTASKCRLDRWARSFRGMTEDAEDLSAQAQRVQWPYVRSVLEEVLTGEVLTRVWTAVLCARDRRHDEQDAEPVARSVLIGHLEARHRVLMLLVRSPRIGAEAAVKLNHLRRRAERWTDLLVGYLAALEDVSEFAFEPQRAKEFARDLRCQCGEPGSRQVWPLVLASLRAAFTQGLEPISPNTDLNAHIASAILASFPAELFDSTGLFRSLWLMRLSNAASDVQGMIEELLMPEPAPQDAPSRLRRFGR